VTDQARALRSVRDAARKAERSRVVRDARIVAAHVAGCSLREVAVAAGVSHQTVKNIVERDGRSTTRDD
jgi:transposase